MAASATAAELASSIEQQEAYIAKLQAFKRQREQLTQQVRSVLSGTSSEVVMPTELQQILLEEEVKVLLEQIKLISSSGGGAASQDRLACVETDEAKPGDGSKKKRRNGKKQKAQEKKKKDKQAGPSHILLSAEEMAKHEADKRILFDALEAFATDVVPLKDVAEGECCREPAWLIDEVVKPAEDDEQQYADDFELDADNPLAHQQ